MLANFFGSFLSIHRMAGVHIALLRVLRLKPALQATVTSPEFKELRAFEDIARVLLTESFWVYVFLMCRGLYAPMRVLRLADQKVAAMDKLQFFVMQANRVMPKYLLQAEHHADSLTDGIKSVIQNTTDLASQVVESDSEDDSDLEGLDGSNDDGDDEEEEEEEAVSTTIVTATVIIYIFMLHSQ